MRDEPQASVDQRERMMESVPAQRSPEYAEDGDDADRAVGVAPVRDDAGEDHGAQARDDEFRPADADRPVDAEPTEAEAEPTEADADRPADAEPAEAEAEPTEAEAEPTDAEATAREAADREAADTARVDREAVDNPAVNTAGADIAGANNAPADVAPGDNAPADNASAYQAPADGDRAGEWEGRSAVDVELPDDAAAGGSAWNNGAGGGVPDGAVSAADAPVPAAAYQTDGRDGPTDREATDREATDREATDREGTDREGEEAHSEEAQDAPGEEAHSELMPGDIPEQPVSALFDEAVANGFRDRWQRVQMQFVDDPRDAADQARALVDDVLNALHEGLNNQRGALDSWQSGQPDDTEQLRVAIRRYRDFLDRMLGI